MSENLWTSDVFRRYANVTLDQNELKTLNYFRKNASSQLIHRIVNTLLSLTLYMHLPPGKPPFSIILLLLSKQRTNQILGSSEF